MRELTLDAIRSFHSDLKAASSAGLQLDLGDLTSGLNAATRSSDLEMALSEIENRLMHAAAGSEVTKSLKTAIDGDSGLPGQYRSALAVWSRTDASPVAVATLVAEPSVYQTEMTRMRLQLVRPLVWVAVSYCVLLFFAVSLVPKFNQLAKQMNYESGLFSFISGISLWMPVWIPLIPILVLVGALFFARRINKRPRRNRSHSMAARNAALADQIAGLVECEVPLQVAMGLANAEFDAAKSSVAQTDSTYTSPVTKDATLPPLLHWASSDDQVGHSKSSNMRSAGRMYRCISDLYVENARRRVTGKVAIFLGGLLVLSLALALFLPVIQLLLFVSGTQGVSQ